MVLNADAPEWHPPVGSPGGPGPWRGALARAPTSRGAALLRSNSGSSGSGSSSNLFTRVFNLHSKT
jgi:hypothetical protein